MQTSRPAPPKKNALGIPPQGRASCGSEAAPLLVLPCYPRLKNLLGQRTGNQKNTGHRVTALLAQRITLPGNSYFWHTGRGESDFPSSNRREPASPSFRRPRPACGGKSCDPRHQGRSVHADLPGSSDGRWLRQTQLAAVSAQRSVHPKNNRKLTKPTRIVNCKNRPLHEANCAKSFVTREGV